MPKTTKPDPTRSAAEPLERSILAAVLVRPDLLVDLEHLLDPAMFTGSRRLVWEEILGLYARGEDIDLITLSSALRGKTGNPGVAAALSMLMTEPAQPGHALTYARRLRSHSQLGRSVEALRRGLAESSNVSPEAPEQVSAWLDEVATDLDESRQAAHAVQRELTLAEGIAEALVRLDSPEEPGIRTGFYDLDDALSGGFRPGKLTVLAGRPGMGKSAFALCIALSLAKSKRGRCAFFSMEMQQAEILERLLAAEGAVDLDRIIRRRLDGIERSRLTEAATMMRQLDMDLIDRATTSVASIRAHIRRSILRGEKLDVVFVDYLQLLHATEKSESRNLEVGRFSRELKAIAMEFGVHIVALCQLSRSVESRQGTRPSLPKLSDLRDSGSIEQDADAVLFLYRQWYYEQDNPQVREQDCSVLVAKNRSGATGEFNVFFFGAQVRFENACMEVETIA